MILSHILKKAFLVLPVLALSACGEGFEPVQYDGFPYGNARTAGTGIAYVRANLAPERGAVLRPEMPSTEDVLHEDIRTLPEPEAEPVTRDPLLDKAEEIFRQIQRK